MDISTDQQLLLISQTRKTEFYISCYMITRSNLDQKKKKSMNLINLESTNLQKREGHGNRIRNLISRLLQQTNSERRRMGGKK